MLSKKPFVKKNFGHENLRTKIVSKKMWVNRILNKKKGLGQKNVGSKNFGSKTFWIKKNWVQIMLGLR